MSRRKQYTRNKKYNNKKIKRTMKRRYNASQLGGVTNRKYDPIKERVTTEGEVDSDDEVLSDEDNESDDESLSSSITSNDNTYKQFESDDESEDERLSSSIKTNDNTYKQFESDDESEDKRLPSSIKSNDNTYKQFESDDESEDERLPSLIKTNDVIYNINNNQYDSDNSDLSSRYVDSGYNTDESQRESDISNKYMENLNDINFSDVNFDEETPRNSMINTKEDMDDFTPISRDNTEDVNIKNNLPDNIEDVNIKSETPDNIEDVNIKNNLPDNIEDVNIDIKENLKNNVNVIDLTNESNESSSNIKEETKPIIKKETKPIIKEEPLPDVTIEKSNKLSNTFNSDNLMVEFIELTDEYWNKTKKENPKDYMKSIIECIDIFKQNNDDQTLQLVQLTIKTTKTINFKKQSDNAINGVIIIYRIENNNVINILLIYETIINITYPKNSNETLKKMLDAISEKTNIDKFEFNLINPPDSVVMLLHYLNSEYNNKKKNIENNKYIFKDIYTNTNNVYSRYNI